MYNSKTANNPSAFARQTFKLLTFVEKCQRAVHSSVTDDLLVIVCQTGSVLEYAIPCLAYALRWCHRNACKSDK